MVDTCLTFSYSSYKSCNRRSDWSLLKVNGAVSNEIAGEIHVRRSKTSINSDACAILVGDHNQAHSCPFFALHDVVCSRCLSTPQMQPDCPARAGAGRLGRVFGEEQGTVLKDKYARAEYFVYCELFILY